MVGINILQRVHKIKFREQVGTCFTIDKDNKQYIITARHIVEKIKDKDKIEIFKAGCWNTVNVRLVGVGKDKVDIAVLGADKLLSPTHHLEFPSVPILGQDVYFLGFPYNLQGNINPKINNYFQLPLVKKGIISALQYVNPTNKHMLIDGLNNPGFSGGPVYYLQDKTHYIAAVISGYMAEQKNIVQKRPPWYHFFCKANNNKTKYKYEHNTGIIEAYHMVYVDELIDAKPIGFKFQSLSS